ncbi:hypothetical protein [Kibdelosporangium phytohabitans]|uniref:Secreted protein n=1 Tax=Kibdelosporangium phytohabitans TaxID=860235 RepID=A0A0N9HX20_9PSEU|nr:hypothetical protein [Kibdelosporangium phytohabitans]ALG08029.1 hypothetical protein AOZ06_14870 [Kibdelosporangium phytohabitans]MBE1471011.1 hypothetical protein [Kibdelosporangium phytohabitans]
MNRTLAAAALLLAAAATLTACDGGPLACRNSAVRKGISLDIDPAYAAKVGSARMTTCWSGSCTDTALELYPSSTSRPMPCTPTGPDSACGARAEPTGGKNSFADLPDLPAGPVDVTLRLIDQAGAELATSRVTITAATRYPDGPECGGGTPQGGLAVSPDGTVSERS